MEIKDLKAAMLARHSVRSYLDKPIPQEIVDALRDAVQECNTASGLHIQLVVDEPQAFGGFMAHYGKFRGVRNYLAFIGPKGADEKIGYYGERLVLKAAQLGLDSCWVAMSYRKGKCPVTVEGGEKLVCVASLGYGETHGVPHKSKPLEDVCKADRELPDWFRSGAEAAQLAPTAMNQQKFLLTLEGDTVQAESTGVFYAKGDRGIVKYHFEVGAGKFHVTWK